jgi:hypothetical protein
VIVARDEEKEFNTEEHRDNEEEKKRLTQRR